MRIGEVAKMLGFCPDTIRSLEKSGKLTFRRDRNGDRRFTEEDVERIRQVMFTGDAGIHQTPTGGGAAS
jgi:excisionase family DNA binding protein